MPIHRAVATFTLDYGKCPKWLFERMVKLGKEMIRVLIEEYGPDEFIRRIANPVWFQSLGTVLAFDWNASGLTTILTAALKEAIRGEEKNLGIFIAGGKGKTSRKTPDEILSWGEKLNFGEGKTQSLVYNSKMSAKVDSSLVQDGYQIYHHSFFFSQNGVWAVVQQGMNTQNQTARRYHWYSTETRIHADETRTYADKARTHADWTRTYADETQTNTDTKPRIETNKEKFDFVCEPHTAIVSLLKSSTLDLTAKKSTKTRNTSIELIDLGYLALMKDIQILRKHSSSLHQTLALKFKDEKFTFLNLENKEFKHHLVEQEDFSKSRYLEKILAQVCETKPKDYEKFLSLQGVGPKTTRALALVSEIIYGAEPSYEDPARYSFAHGGKDATPYPIACSTYDNTIQIMKKIVAKTKLDFTEKKRIMETLEK